MKKWILALLYLMMIVLAFLYKNHLLRWLADSSQAQIPVLLGLATLIALVPIVPFGVIAGMMGSKYGPLIGGLINITASTIAAVLMFMLVKAVFEHQGRAYMKKFKHLERLTVLFERNPFIAVLTARLIPIVPAPAVNIYAALSGIPFLTYVLATVIGKIPVMLVFALIGDQIWESPQHVMLVGGIYIIFLALVYGGYRIFQSRATLH